MRRWMMQLTSGMTLALLSWSVPAFADFGVTVSGQAEIIDPPDSALLNQSQSNKYQVWYEGCETLAEDLHVDYVADHHDPHDSELSRSTNNSEFEFGEFLRGHKILEGTCVCSYFVHFDPHRFSDQLFVNPHATLTFEKQILGIAYRDHRLDQSDFLGAPGTTYPTGSNIRGLEFFDNFEVSDDGYSLELSFLARYGFDQIRVFTVGCCDQNGPGVPEPASLVVWSLAGVVGGGLRVIRSRRKKPVF